MITVASIKAMRRRALANTHSEFWAENSKNAALVKAADDVNRLCDEIERLSNQR